MRGEPRRTILNRATLARHSKRKGETRRSPAKRAKATAPHHREKQGSKGAKLKRSARILPNGSVQKSVRVLVTSKNGGHPPGAEEEVSSELQSPADIESRIRDLTKLAKEQGYLTFEDLNEALP